MNQAVVLGRRGSDTGRSLRRDLLASVRAPEFWALSSWLDIVIRFRQSRLGILWLLVPSIAYIWGLGPFMAALRKEQLLVFIPHVAVGYAVFRLIQMMVSESAAAFTTSASFILDGHMRLTDFVLRVLAKGLFHFVATIPAVTVALVLGSGVQWWGLLPALVSFPLVVAALLPIAVLFALIGARLPDLGQLVNTVLMFAFLFTPIVWRAHEMPADSLRGAFVRLNPLFHLLEIVRAPLLGEPLELLSVVVVIAMAVVGWIVAAHAYRRYAPFVPLWI